MQIFPNKYKQFLIGAFSLVSLAACVISLICFLPTLDKEKNVVWAAFAANLAMPYAQYDDLPKSKQADIFATDYKNILNINGKCLRTDEKIINNMNVDDNIKDILKSVPQFTLPSVPQEPTHKVTECLFGATGLKYENFYIDDKAGINPDIKRILSEKPNIKVSRGELPEVLIFHTHTGEAYMDKDQGFYYNSYTGRTDDVTQNVVQVGSAIAKSLQSYGIKTLHDTTIHDDGSYRGSYDRSAATIDKRLKEYPGIKVAIDIHRDCLGNNEKGKIKPTFTVNGRKAAQIMIIGGCDPEGKLSFPHWKENLKFGMRVHQKAEDMYPGMTRAMLMRKSRYNMDKTLGSMLIEVGSDVNTLDEAVFSGALLGKVLAEALTDLT